MTSFDPLKHLQVKGAEETKSGEQVFNTFLVSKRRESLIAQ